ncbi:MAG: hypothetical protein B6D39_07170 [Anaerolineae bacterium UTCFX2]|jgi:2,3-diketo-5-methylthio-1-phosphopentane phosphatase|nr:MtnX-like HAD-IB family phosphatase [Anaerolineae bacterium]MCZ7552892.1 MtnX-like HAD-IB family phosphatase [Anaerolineales bacterium]OQY91448.1 MAG: hypothetical protein B6D39_07170 [Anaerolineae bacterium UTCFX2]
MADRTPKLTILCDFDGTITPSDLTDFIYEKFAGCGLYYLKLWSQYLIDTREEILRTFETITASQEEIAAALTSIPIDPTFYELVTFSRQNDIELVIVSDGLDWAIETVLGAHGIQGLPIISNHMVFGENKLTCEFPWYDPLTPMAGVCKPLVVRHYQQKDGLVIYIGDGRSDQDAVMEADLVFAKDALAVYCQEHKIPALSFTDFSDICSQIAQWLTDHL